MLEIILGILLCAGMGKIASAGGRSAMVWIGVTFVLCALSLVIPLPFLRILIAGGVAFLIMTFTNKS